MHTRGKQRRVGRDGLDLERLCTWYKVSECTGICRKPGIEPSDLEADWRWTLSAGNRSRHSGDVAITACQTILRVVGARGGLTYLIRCIHAFSIRSDQLQERNLDVTLASCHADHGCSPSVSKRNPKDVMILRSQPWF